jgi:hypothetical protein
MSIALNIHVSFLYSLPRTAIYSQHRFSSPRFFGAPSDRTYVGSAPRSNSLPNRTLRSKEVFVRDNNRVFGPEPFQTVQFLDLATLPRPVSRGHLIFDARAVDCARRHIRCNIFTKRATSYSRQVSTSSGSAEAAINYTESCGRNVHAPTPTASSLASRSHVNSAARDVRPAQRRRSRGCTRSCRYGKKSAGPCNSK